MAAPQPSYAVEVDTPHGPARAHLHEVADPVAALVLGHGAGGGVTAPDLTAVTQAALAEHVTVALVEQPYRVAGRRSPAPVKQLDTAWIAVLERLRSRELGNRPLIVGGRSAGARVACRTAAQTGAAGVLCLAFPLKPPGRRGAAGHKDEPQTREPELDAVAVPVLVVQGAQDPFGVPAPRPSREVVTVRGNHSLRTDLEAIAAAAGQWLDRVLAPERVAS